jgi:hypothetical protein
MWSEITFLSSSAETLNPATEMAVELGPDSCPNTSQPRDRIRRNFSCCSELSGAGKLLVTNICAFAGVGISMKINQSFAAVGPGTTLTGAHPTAFFTISYTSSNLVSQLKPTAETNVAVGSVIRGGPASTGALGTKGSPYSTTISSPSTTRPGEENQKSQQFHFSSGAI